MDVEIKDNTQEVLKELLSKEELILSAMGETAEKYAKLGCPVDTGRLRNSITHREDKTTTYIGTNVEYAESMELNHPRQSHYLRNAIANHVEEYEGLAKKLLK